MSVAVLLSNVYNAKTLAGGEVTGTEVCGQRRLNCDRAPIPVEVSALITVVEDTACLLGGRQAVSRRAAVVREVVSPGNIFADC